MIDDRIETQVNLAPLTWWELGGKADYFFAPQSLLEVEQALEWAFRKKLPVTVLGGGSNVLISDEGVEGLVLHLERLNQIEQSVQEDQRLKLLVQAGCPKSSLTKTFLQAGLAPALFLCGLPGDTGGGVVMNAGVSEAIEPKEFREIVDSVEVIRIDLNGNAQRIHFTKEQLSWHYRHSEGWQPGVIVRVALSWPLERDPGIMAQVKKATQARLQKQPLNLPSCGSVFKNPEGHKAGALIEKAGLKGFSMGGLEVSTKHANFIVNPKKNGRARDADALIRHIQETVKSKFGVSLSPEVQYMGRWNNQR